MELNSFLRLTEEIMQKPNNSVDADTLVTEIPEWDSLALITMISLAEAEFGHTPDLDQLQEAKTLGEMFRLLERKS